RFRVRGTHRELVGRVKRPAVVVDLAGQGVVVVPGSRADGRLDTAVVLARSLGWPLLVLCSRGLAAPSVRRRLEPHTGLQLTAVDLLSTTGIRAHRPWQALEHRAARQRAAIDTHRKRNLALLAATMLGRRWVLFVDDDITGLEQGRVEAAVGHLTRRPQQHLVGWPYPHFPDNSVVHHARRDVLELPQEVFIAGGALLVDLADKVPAPFPPVYNEDWLFLFDALTESAVVEGPDVRQEDYDPYADPARAGLEEFGDVLGEGLFHLLHEQAAVEVATDPVYWRDVLAKRRKLLGRITERARELSASGPDAQKMQQVVAAMTEARRQHTWVTEESLADFVRRWRADQDTWAEFYAGLPRRDTVKEALVYLGLHEAWIVTSGPKR
ncbi:MAG TPA: hypothetical protein VE781_15380, partial [Kineosporiaceae bacterium]|nr:hypothetical protein [Kineosporiaceae bacterium]